MTCKGKDRATPEFASPGAKRKNKCLQVQRNSVILNHLGLLDIYYSDLSCPISFPKRLAGELNSLL